MGAIVGEIVKALAGGIGSGIEGMAKAHDIQAPQTHSIASFNGGGSAPSGVSAIPGIVQAEEAKNPVPEQKAPEINIDTSKSSADSAAQAEAANALRPGGKQGGGLIDSILSDENQKENIEPSDYGIMRDYVSKMRGKK